MVVLEALGAEEYYRSDDDAADNNNAASGAGAVAKVTPNGLRALAAIDPALPSKVIERGAKLTGIAVMELIRDRGGGGDADDEDDDNQNDNGETTVVKHVMRDDPEPATGWPQILIRWSVLRQLLQELLIGDPPDE